MSRPVILAYHAIGDCARDDDPHNLFITQDRFSQQMAYLARKKKVVALDDIVTGRVRGRSHVAITFDDAYRNVLQMALPLLGRHGFPATVFAPTAFLGRRNTWIEPTTCDVDIMTMEELRELEANGVSIESHGHHHLDFSTSSPDEARADLVRSIEILGDGLGRKIKHLAWPYGLSNPTAEAAAEQLGFRAAYSIDRKHGGRFAWERVQVTPLDGDRSFALKSSGYYHWLRHSTLGAAAFTAVRPLLRASRRVAGA